MPRFDIAVGFWLLVHMTGFFGRVHSFVPRTLATWRGYQQPAPSTMITNGATRLFMNKTTKSSSSTTKNNKKKASSTEKSNAKGGFGATLSSRQPKSSSFPYSGSIRPGIISPQRIITTTSTSSSNEIQLPDYALDGVPKKGSSPPPLPWIIEVKQPPEIEKMRAAGQLARQILDMAGRMVQVGITTDEIDTAVHEATIAAGAYPSPLNYYGYPKSCCTSVNEVVCHGIPDNRPLEKGDIINIDITTYLRGYHGDCSEMFVVGGEDAADPDTKQLLQVTYDCWITACKYVQPGRHYQDLGGLIEDYVVARGFSTVRDFCGHGIGTVFQTTPDILHYRNKERRGQMQAGHTFTIEPMINQGTNKILNWKDGWTATTLDGRRSAQFEHTLLVTEDGVEALTAKNENSPLQFWEKESKVHQGFFLGTSANALHRAASMASQDC